MKFLFAFLMFSTQALACDFNFILKGVCGTVRWTQGPVLRTETTLEIEFSPAVDATKLHFDAWMPAMGHGTRPVALNIREDGVVEVSKLFFVMPGLWVLRARLPIIEDTEEGSIVELAEMPVQI